MADEKFVDFARRRLKFGTAPADVAATLRVNGLSEAEIAEVLAAAQIAPAPESPSLPPTPPVAPPPPPPEPVAEPAPIVPPPPAPPVDPLPVMFPQEAPSPIEQPPTIVPQQIAPEPVMSHISVMPKMPSPMAVPKMEVAPAVPREPMASIFAVSQQAPPAVVPEAPAPLIYAGFWRRVVAALIDGVILTFLYAAVVIGASFALGTSNATYLAEYMKGVGGIITAISLLVMALYHPLFEASPMQGSLGKHFVGIFVTDMEGHRIGLWRALMRNLAKVTSSVLLCIGYFMIAFTKQKQGLHDMIAGCLVLKHEHHQEG